MSDNRTEQLLDTLIQQVSKLTASVDHLVSIDAARIEKEKHQEEKNEEVKKFMGDYRSTLDRVKTWHETLDKVKVPLIFAVIVALGTLLGINWKA
ncbi:MAG: hypothetical protein ACPGUE_12005 [Marinomonas sp.]